MKKYAKKIRQKSVIFLAIAFVLSVSIVLVVKTLTSTPITLADSATFKPVADSYISQANPGVNYGTSKELRIEGSPLTNSYLRFNVRGPSGPVTKATLRVYASSSQNLGFKVTGVLDNSWGEHNLTWSNGPAVTTIVFGSSGQIAQGTWITVDITPLVSGNGLISMVLSTSGSTPISLASRESANSPELIIQTSSGSASSGSTAIPIPAKGAYFGASVWDGVTQTPGYPHLSNLQQFETAVSKQLFTVHTGWSDNGPGSLVYLQSLNSLHNVVPLISVTSDNRTLAEIATNTISPNDKRANFQVKPDDFYRDWARLIKTYGKPVFFRWNHEMNGAWDTWCVNDLPGQCLDQDSGLKQNSLDYIFTWRHVRNIFAQEDVTNAAWVWCPNAILHDHMDFSKLYPGDSYVDWTCLDWYNWSPPDAWQSFTQGVKASYDQLLSIAPGKPIMIGEFATADGGDTTGSKQATWITSTFKTEIPGSFPKIKAVVYYDVNATAAPTKVNWYIDNKPSVIAAFKQAVASSYYLSKAP